MYEKYAPKKWKLEIINILKSEAGGFKEVIFSKWKRYLLILNMNRVFIEFKEFQRQRHKEGSYFGSNCWVLPEAEDVDIEIKETDLRIDVFRAGGPGGQSVNTDSAVRITHIPRVVVSQQDEKSQHKTKLKH